MIGLAYQQAMWTCGTFATQNSATGQVSKYRIKPRMGGSNTPGYCVRSARRDRRLQAVEPLCGYRRRLQAMTPPYYCPVMSGKQCYKC